MEYNEIIEQTDELRLFAAAQKEASDLVWQHQNPDLEMKSDQPYHYKDYLQKKSLKYNNTRSANYNGRTSPSTNSSKNSPLIRSSFNRGSESCREWTPKGRASICSSDLYGLHQKYEENGAGCKNHISYRALKDDCRKQIPRIGSQHTTHGLRSSFPSRSNSDRGKISEEVRSILCNGEQIREESKPGITRPESTLELRDIPLPLRIKSKNSPNRVQFSSDVEILSRNTRLKSSQNPHLHTVQKSISPQILNSSYISNPPPKCLLNKTADLDNKSVTKSKNGLEIRSDEIRQATSMLLKDRSPKLPIPSAVSDKPSRPIVSFDSNWKPKEADLKPETQRIPAKNVESGQRVPERSCSKVDSISPPAKYVPSASSKKVTRFYTKAVPIENEILNSRSSQADNSTGSPSIPAVTPAETLSISITGPDFSEITNSSSENKPRRALPIPSPNRRYYPNSSAELPRGHWSPAVGKRATATCHQCGLPIENQVLKVGANEHYHRECFRCATCRTELESLEIYPEPCSKRIERLSRIERRARGEILPEIEGHTKEDDGDERKRYYCHLDFHENFAPRCKHCKTPIIGEHLVALGEHWHHGHFFCAECGDPFDKGATHIEKDGYAWCLSCQTKRTERQAPKCQKCKKSVVGQYIQALGGEWHEDCFQCANCNNGLHDGSFYPKRIGDETVVLCMECTERELKS